jgi:Fe2+ or Zn2+ uptake regulation protein
LLEISLLDDAEARTRLAIEAIVAYLGRWPQAADTEHGIAQWWLPEMGVDVPLANVRTALERLVQAKLVTRTSLPDGSEIYRAAAATPRP